MSHTMNKEIQNIHYCTILSAGQWDFLLEGRFSPLRQKCLYRLMNGAVRTRTAYRIKGIDIVSSSSTKDNSISTCVNSG